MPDIDKVLLAAVRCEMVLDQIKHAANSFENNVIHIRIESFRLHAKRLINLFAPHREEKLSPSKCDLCSSYDVYFNPVDVAVQCHSCGCQISRIGNNVALRQKHLEDYVNRCIEDACIGDQD